MNRILKPVIFVIAAVYIGVDAVFFAIAKPVADWVSKLRILDGLAAWIVSLRPYPTLALFMVPVIVLEPIKPFAAYMVATGHLKVALTTLAVGEILKLVILERLFSISRDKLMLIPAFGWTYRKFCQIKNWLEVTETWQAARHWSKVAQNAGSVGFRKGAGRRGPRPLWCAFTRLPEKLNPRSLSRAFFARRGCWRLALLWQNLAIDWRNWIPESDFQ